MRRTEEGVKRVVVLATLDTKGEEAAFVADRIRERGHAPWLIDLSLLSPPVVAPDTDRDQLARAEDVAGLPRAQAMEVVAAGAARIVSRMVETQEAHGVIAIGGGTGTWMGMTIMRSLPLGLPKVMVSTLSSRDGRSDIMVMPSVADIAGLNSVLTPILANAAAAISGMVEGARIDVDRSRPTIAMTMFGLTTRGGTFARRFLEAAGFEVVVFHATGSGGATMEDLIRRGAFAGVLDWTTTEVTDHLFGGVCDAGPTRLDAAATMGVPQVVVPGAIDMINITGAIPKRFARRTYHMHLPTVPLIRTSARESREIGAWIARKLNRATAPVRVLIPAGGFSGIDIDGNPFHDPAANLAFVSALRRQLRSDIAVEVVPHHINDEAFARVAADALLGLGIVARAPVVV
jgi:uncharacterized protein (UPF0261 family)